MVGTPTRGGSWAVWYKTGRRAFTSSMAHVSARLPLTPALRPGALLSRERTPPTPRPSTNFLGRLRGSLEAGRAPCSCRTETVASARDPDVPGHSSGRKRHPWGRRGQEAGEEEGQRLPEGCTLPLRGCLSRRCSRLVPRPRSGSLILETSGPRSSQPGEQG